MGVEFNDQEGATYEIDQKPEKYDTEEPEFNLVDDLRSKTLQANGETLEEMLHRFGKTINRHERDLIKL